MPKYTTEELKKQYGVTPTTTAAQTFTTDELQTRYGVMPGTQQSGTNEQNVPQKDGFIKTLAKETIRPFARLGVNAYGASKPIIGTLQGKSVQEISQDMQDIAQKGVNLPFLGQTKPVGQTGDYAQDLKESIGTGLQASGTVIPVGKVPGFATKLITSPTARTAARVGIEGGFGGSLIGAGEEMQEKSATVGSVARQGAIGAGLGLAGGTVLGGVGAGLGKVVSARAFRENPVPTLKNEITDFLQNSTKSLSNATARFKSELNTDVTDILSQPKVYEQIKPTGGTITRDSIDNATAVIQDEVDTLMGKQDEFIGQVRQYVPKATRYDIQQEAMKFIDGLPADMGSLRDKLMRQIEAIPEELDVDTLRSLAATARKQARKLSGIQKDNSIYTALENAFRNVLFKNVDTVAERFSPEDKGAYALLRNTIKDDLNTINFLNKYLLNARVAGGRLGVYFGRTIGAIAGAKGGPLGAIFGSEVGGFITRVLMDRTLGNSTKMRLIRQMTDDPAVINAVNQIIKNVDDYRPLLLPEGAIQVPQGGFTPKPDTSSVSITPAGKGIPGVNPQTGRFMRTFSSTGENLNQRPNLSSIAAEKSTPITTNPMNPNTAITPTKPSLNIKSNSSAVDNTLLNEAKKYKSAEEFVNAQGVPVYHQSQSKVPFTEFKQKGDVGYKKADYSQANEGIYFSPDKNLVTSKYGKDGGVVIESVLTPKKKLDLGEYDAMYFDGRKVNSGDIVVENFKRSQQGLPELPEPDILLTGISKKAKTWLEKNGYDVVEGMKGEMWSAPEVVVLDKSIIKIKSQLTDIWKQAHNK